MIGERSLQIFSEVYRTGSIRRAGGFRPGCKIGEDCY